MLTRFSKSRTFAMICDFIASRKINPRKVRDSFFIGLSLVGAIFLVSLVAVFFNSFKTKEATLLLAFENNGQGRMFTGEVVSGMTILDALLVSSEAGQIKLGYHPEQDGKLVIEELDGYTAGTSGKELVFYLNKGKVSVQEINRVAIHPGDKIEVRIE